MPRTKHPSAITAIERVVRDTDPVIKELAEITQTLFKKVAQNLTPSNMKQSFQKLFRFIYIKKVKRLYNYNWSSNLTDSPTGTKEIKNDKEGFVYENYEDFLQECDIYRCLGAQLGRGSTRRCPPEG